LTIGGAGATEPALAEVVVDRVDDTAAITVDVP
jgi:hypothetical protein